MESLAAIGSFNTQSNMHMSKRACVICMHAWNPEYRVSTPNLTYASVKSMHNLYTKSQVYRPGLPQVIQGHVRCWEGGSVISDELESYNSP